MRFLLIIIAALLFARTLIDANRRGHAAKFVVAFVFTWVMLSLMGI